MRAVRLTPTERLVLAAISRDARPLEIAAARGVKPKTVRFHLNNLYHKLGVHHRRDAVAKGRSLGLIPVSRTTARERN